MAQLLVFCYRQPNSNVSKDVSLKPSMVKFIAEIKKFDQQGEKTGWTFIDIPEKIALQILPENKKAFRVKGLLDNLPISGISLIPIGGGDFIMPLNATLRKQIKKGKGATLQVSLALDTNPVILSEELMQCLSDEPAALAYFNKLPGSHQKYYSRWIESAKTDATKAKRIAQTVTACTRQQQFNEMMREHKQESDKDGN